MLQDFKNKSVFLLANVLVEGCMPNVLLNCALHHCASIVVFDVAFPARFVEVVDVGEALFAEVFNSVVVCIGQKVVQVLRLRMVFQLVHQARPVPFNLLLGRDC